ncbi:methylase involved in ubiquinone/menaquinone biosynthesis [Desulfosporosinus orientis DSM 765]|uniref:Methylase involved in ubiquinone/menaquinone biosynthesis n=1 Tax=Desulfosporosinus orientis (strain ATCC 19365 / DSM 765 / NCIMB 8382 / VKM B-1628 / Singapore I) TaxID=768706 RepID=G7WA47_DESOD|nr:class I SAM-dependent methyltransferase [Desulfosporosinus orientis]AET66185.1 methylase involved in ubiquinone/menaquinone biosynthesis [Desulfosporosinus orientis DSM 765]
MEVNDFARLWSDGKSPKASAQSFWDNRADEFNKSASQGHTDERIRKIVEYLSFNNLLTKNSSVLDIGCGPGKFAVEFAKRSKEAIGIDISENMLGYAVSNAETASLTNVSFKNANWDEVDLEEYDWKKKFDLVTAINSPGIHDPLTLEKMIAASKGYCFLSNFVDRHDSVQDVLRIVLNIKEKRFYRNTIYSIFNILWLKGYYPSITYIDTDREHTRTLDEACSYYETLLETEKELEKSTLIKNYLQQIAIKGLITERVQTKTAWLYWKV